MKNQPLVPIFTVVHNYKIVVYLFIAEMMLNCRASPGIICSAGLKNRNMGTKLTSDTRFARIAGRGTWSTPTHKNAKHTPTK